MQYINDLNNIWMLLRYGTYVCVLLIMLCCLVSIVMWAKAAPKGAYLFLAIFPLISLFPIPGEEIKKLQRIKQEQIKEDDESGEPPDTL